MATYYINADTGSDVTGDGSENNPWETLAHAIDNSSTDDTIICQDSTATFAWVTDIIPARTIRAVELGDAVFDAADAAISWTFRGTIVLERLIFQNAHSGGGTNSSLTYTDGSYSTDITIRQCIFRDIGLANGMRLGVLGTTTSKGSVVWNLTLIGCLFDDCHFYSVSSNDGGIITENFQAWDTVIVQNCTFYFVTNGNHAFEYVFRAGPDTITNCIFSNATGQTIELQNYGTPTTTYSCNHNISSFPAGAGNIAADPLFIDPANDNFRLQPTSPCIDAGTIL